MCSWSFTEKHANSASYSHNVWDLKQFLESLLKYKSMCIVLVNTVSTILFFAIFFWYCELFSCWWSPLPGEVKLSSVFENCFCQHYMAHFNKMNLNEFLWKSFTFVTLFVWSNLFIKYSYVYSSKSFYLRNSPTVDLIKTFSFAYWHNFTWYPAVVSFSRDWEPIYSRTDQWQYSLYSNGFQ